MDKENVVPMQSGTDGCDTVGQCLSLPGQPVAFDSCSSQAGTGMSAETA